MTPLGSPVVVEDPDVASAITTAMKVPSPSTRQTIRRTSACGLPRKNFTRSRTGVGLYVLAYLKKKPAATYSPRLLRAKYHRR